jgi:hypothetical protein
VADASMRELERVVRAGGDEAARVALSRERTRAGLPDLWGYAPRWCGEEERWHLPGAAWDCRGCERARAEAVLHVQRNDMPTNGSHWQRRALATVALVQRVTPPGTPLREVRAALREVRPSRWDAAIERQWFSREVVRAFPGLGRKPKPAPLGPSDSPLFAEKVPHGS